MEGNTYRDVLLILKNGNYYTLTYKYNNFYEVLYEKKNDIYDEEEGFINNSFAGTILYKHI